MSKLDDLEIKIKIKLALMANPHIGGLDISVDMINGIVFLKGFVQDSDKKLLAEEIARSHGGIDVKNDIEVLAEASETVDAPAEFSVESPDIAEDNKAIQDRVIGSLGADPRVKVFSINVEAADGVVRLSGVQDDEEGRRRAEEIALRVSGVKKVVNDIHVKRAA